MDKEANKALEWYRVDHHTVLGVNLRPTISELFSVYVASTC
jgi:hypothetical protein